MHTHAHTRTHARTGTEQINVLLLYYVGVRLSLHGRDINRVTTFKLFGVSLVQICHETAMLHIYFKKLQSECTALIIWFVLVFQFVTCVFIAQ